MRRILSILLVLALGSGPAIAAVPASAFSLGLASALRAGLTGQQDESHLPACCRRNGKHHCAMSMSGDNSGSTLSSTQEITIAATETCPCMPRSMASTGPSIAALLLQQNEPQIFPAQRRALQAALPAARITDRRSWPKRGPPQDHSL